MKFKVHSLRTWKRTNASQTVRKTTLVHKSLDFFHLVSFLLDLINFPIAFSVFNFVEKVCRVSFNFWASRHRHSFTHPRCWVVHAKLTLQLSFCFKNADSYIKWTAFSNLNYSRPHQSNGADAPHSVLFLFLYYFHHSTAFAQLLFLVDSWQKQSLPVYVSNISLLKHKPFHSLIISLIV